MSWAHKQPNGNTYLSMLLLEVRKVYFPESSIYKKTITKVSIYSLVIIPVFHLSHKHGKKQNQNSPPKPGLLSFTYNNTPNTLTETLIYTTKVYLLERF